MRWTITVRGYKSQVIWWASFLLPVRVIFSPYSQQTLYFQSHYCKIAINEVKLSEMVKNSKIALIRKYAHYCYDRCLHWFRLYHQLQGMNFADPQHLSSRRWFFEINGCSWRERGLLIHLRKLFGPISFKLQKPKNLKIDFIKVKWIYLFSFLSIISHYSYNDWIFITLDSPPHLNETKSK